MAPSPVPAGPRGWQPGAWRNKQAGGKPLAGDQFLAHCSCRGRSWGHPAWLAGLSKQDGGRFAMGLSPAMGSREMLWGSPGPASPSMGHLPTGSRLCSLCRGRHRAYLCFRVLDEASGFGVSCGVTTSRMIPEHLVLNQGYNCQGWAPASHFPKSVSSPGRAALSHLPPAFPLRSAKKHFQGSLTGTFHIQQNCCTQECSCVPETEPVCLEWFSGLCLGGETLAEGREESKCTKSSIIRGKDHVKPDSLKP